MDGKITTVVFDFGKVLLEYDWKKLALRVTGSEEEASEFLKMVFKDGKWRKIDKGQWSFKDFMDKNYEEFPQWADKLERFFNEMPSVFSPLEYAKDWIVDLKNRGYNVLYISNYSDELITKTLDCLYFVPLLNGGIISAREKLIKPEPEIYELLCRRFEVSPQECVFIDDMPDNITGAENVGMSGILFKNYEQARADLDDLLRIRGIENN